MNRAIAFRRLLKLLAPLAALCLLLAGPAHATGIRGKTITYTLHVAAMPVDNLCNADAVILDGDLHRCGSRSPTSASRRLVSRLTCAAGLAAATQHPPGWLRWCRCASMSARTRA